MKKVQGDLDQTGKKVGGFGALMKTGFTAAVVGGAAALGGLGLALKSSIDKAATMEQSLADITAAMGLGAEEAADMGELIRELGLDPKLKVSAEEAADAIMVLGTAGLTTTEILDGAARSTVLLANATGSDFASSAAAASDVMAIFKISAEDMDAAVNGIVATTQASKFTFDDYALALSQGGGVAATVGVEFEDFNATIAAISPLFASGSDAGTSLKTMLTALVPKSNDAEDAMYALGIITEDGSNRFFDANGNLKDMAEIAGILNTALGGLSEEQKNQALSTIFGSDAMRAAAALAEYSEVQFKELKATMGKVDAEEAAATRMDTLSGRFEIFNGIIDQTATDIGTAILPELRNLLDILIQLATDNGPAIVEFFKNIAVGTIDMVNGFGKYWPQISGIVTRAADAINVDMGRITTNLGVIDDWLSGGEADGTVDRWETFWLSIVGGFTGAATFIVKVVGDITETMAIFAKQVQALQSGDWGGFGDAYQQQIELTRQYAGKTWTQLLAEHAFGMALDVYSNKRAAGGPVSGGQSYLVGEEGPEMFTPSSSGYVHDAATTAGWGGERTIRVVVESPLPTNREAIRQIALALKQEIDLTGAVSYR
jgi:TP901 family phage tail tape measure protein